jgi:HTH-type transcriptional regulator, sugar sensing transcriptional regulator
MGPETLQKIGLTPGEAKIYWALLDLGQSTTGPIVTKSKVSTSKTYKILKRLETKGLVSHIIKKNVKHWSAANPKRILELLEQHETDLKRRKSEIEDIMPQLLKKINQVKEKQQAEVYTGMKGMISVFNEELSYYKEHPNEINYVIGVTRRYPKPIYNFFYRLEQKRDKLKMKRHFLFGEDARGTWPILENSNYSKVKYLPYASIVSVNIYGETSFISIFTEDPIFFVIKSKEIAKSFTAYFKLLWKLAKL